MKAEELTMQVEIVQKAPFVLIGKSNAISSQNGENLKAIPAFWKQVMHDGTMQVLMPFAKTSDTYGVCMNFEPAQQRFTYMIAVETEATPFDASFERVEVAAHTWAVFSSRGRLPTAIQSVWQTIYESWFPNQTEYVHADGPEIERYFEGDTQSPDYRCEVWIPVIKK
jgi:AraC family transcriptional regulator